LSPAKELKAADENLEAYKGTMAIVGMSCRFPGANSPSEYWDLLSQGREAIRRFPSDRPFLGLPEARDMEAGFLKCPVDEFDAKFFGISPREALLVDPQQRLLLEMTWESLEDAGINPQKLRSSDTGVYVGMWQQDYERIIFESKRVEEDSTTDFLHVFLGNKYSATASRISFCLGLNGPAMAIESGCSSSLNGLHLACESLRNGEISMALVSGVNLILLPFNPFSGRAEEEESIVLSKDYKCKTFDESADGFVR
jgi:acyl transferase domain-containing protein